MTARPPSLFDVGAPRVLALADGAAARVETCEGGPLGDQAAQMVAGGRGYLAFALGDVDTRARLFGPCVQRDRLAALRVNDRFGGYLAFEVEGRGALTPQRGDFRRVYGARSGWRATIFDLSCAPQPGDAVYLTQLHVVREARRRGAGRALCAWLAEAARRAGYRRILVDVARGNAGAIALYESLGYRPSTVGLDAGQRLLRAARIFDYRRYALDLGADAQR